MLFAVPERPLPPPPEPEPESDDQESEGSEDDHEEDDEKADDQPAFDVEPDEAGSAEEQLAQPRSELSEANSVDREEKKGVGSSSSDRPSIALEVALFAENAFVDDLLSAGQSRRGRQRRLTGKGAAALYSHADM